MWQSAKGIAEEAAGYLGPLEKPAKKLIQLFDLVDRHNNLPLKLAELSTILMQLKVAMELLGDQLFL